MPLLCGVRFSVEGRVVVCLVFVGADHSETTLKTAVVVPVDPSGGRVLDVGDGLVGAGVENGRADAVGLVEPVDRLCRCLGYADTWASSGAEGRIVGDLVGMRQRRSRKDHRDFVVLRAPHPRDGRATLGWEMT